MEIYIQNCARTLRIRTNSPAYLQCFEKKNVFCKSSRSGLLRSRSECRSTEGRSVLFLFFHRRKNFFVFFLSQKYLCVFYRRNTCRRRENRRRPVAAPPWPPPPSCRTRTCWCASPSRRPRRRPRTPAKYAVTVATGPTSRVTSECTRARSRTAARSAASASLCAATCSSTRANTTYATATRRPRPSPFAPLDRPRRGPIVVTSDEGAAGGVGRVDGKQLVRKHLVVCGCCVTVGTVTNNVGCWQAVVFWNCVQSTVSPWSTNGSVEA